GKQNGVGTESIQRRILIYEHIVKQIVFPNIHIGSHTKKAREHPTLQAVEKVGHPQNASCMLFVSLQGYAYFGYIQPVCAVAKPGASPGTIFLGLMVS
ncbi:MAG TPA: hypothetical protein DER23_07545, partial [Clostridiales bacterium]|nr:hypothetical protein [Clostridiales bacterium]